MKVEQLVQFLRNSVSIQDSGTSDPAYLSMSDEEIALYLNVVLSRDYPQLPSIEFVTGEQLFPVILLAKKELYYALAVKNAPLYDIGADNNNYLKRSQRFDHYLKLIAQLDKEFEEYQKNGGGQNTLTSFNVTLHNRYYTKYNYENGKPPVIYNFEPLSITHDSVEIGWLFNSEGFTRYLIFVSKNPIVDEFILGNKIDPEAKLVANITDVFNNKVRIAELEPETDYYIALVVEDRSFRKSYATIKITTKAVTP